MIGVNKYSDLKQLEYAASDQWALADRLESVGFPKDQIFVLSEQTRSGDPTADVRRLPIQRNIERGWARWST